MVSHFSIPTSCTVCHGKAQLSGTSCSLQSSDGRLNSKGTTIDSASQYSSCHGDAVTAAASGMEEATLVQGPGYGTVVGSAVAGASVDGAGLVGPRPEVEVC